MLILVIAGFGAENPKIAPVPSHSPRPHTKKRTPRFFAGSRSAPTGRTEAPTNVRDPLKRVGASPTPEELTALKRGAVDLIVGIALIVVGVLMVVGRLGLEGLLPYAGIVLIVLGILVLVRTLAGGALIGIAALVAGVLLVIGFFDLPREIEDWMWVVNLVAGIVLIVLGVRRIL